MLSSPLARRSIVALMLVVPSTAEADARFAKEPHVLVFSDRQQVVLFSDSRPAGAIATRRSDGSIDVIVPDAVLDDSLVGTESSGPPVGEGEAATRVRLDRTPDGDVRVRLRPAGEVGRVLAHAVSKPPRLVIDLLPPETGADAPPARQASEAPTGVAIAAEASSARATRGGRGSPAAQASPEGRDLDPAQAPAAETAEMGPVVAAGHSVAVGFGAMGAEPSLAGLDSSSIAPFCAARPTPEAGGGEPSEPVSEAPRVARLEPAPSGTPSRSPVGWHRSLDEPSPAGDPHCRFLRVHGRPFCAPEPELPVYRDDAYAAGIAHSIATGVRVLPPVRREASPAAAFLAGDRAYVMGARTGWFLPAVQAYERAARRFPEFPDVTRARRNVAWAYAELEFAPELLVEARNPHNSARDFAGALLGDLLLREGRVAEAASWYERAAGGSPMAACLAARGLAAVALAEGRVERAHTGLAGLRDLCPPALVRDSATESLRARLQVALGEPDRALATLESAASRASGREVVALARERAWVLETAGRLDEARRIWADFESGRYGRRHELEGAIALARLGDDLSRVEESLTRAERLPPRERETARQNLFASLSEVARADGDPFAVLALVLAEGVPAESLDTAGRIAVAAAERRLGLVAQAEALLEEAEAESGGALPEPYWRERLAIALDRADLAEARQLLARWRTARGGNPSAAELAMRARVLAAEGGGADEIEDLLDRLDGWDAGQSLRTRWAVARLWAERDPARALAWVAPGDAPGALEVPEEVPVAETLWRIGRAAQTSGDLQTALAAYRALSDRAPATTLGADAAYRAGRILEARGNLAGARHAYERASHHPRDLDRRVALASIRFQDIVEPWARRREKR